jgi:hypothetical protein
MTALTAGFAALLTTGCGNQYRPVVTAISPVGPAGQPTKYAVAVSTPAPGTSTPGLVTVVDFSGDTVLATPQILSNPSYFQVNTSGTEGFVVNAQGSLDFFSLSNPGQGALITSNVGQTTLPVNSSPVSINTFSPASAINTIFIPQTATSSVAALNSGTSALYQETAVPANPVYVVGTDGTPRVYVLSHGSNPGVTAGVITPLEATSATSLSPSTAIPAGISPVYGVMSADDRRAYVLNQGSGNVSVINVVNNALDSTTPTITIPNIAYSGGSAAPNPVWADFSPATTELVVLNQGDKVHPGTLSIINIPLCNTTVPVTNPNCNASNPVDATGFGQIVSTVTVGINPTMVSVMRSGTPVAYVSNQGNAALNINGSISVVDLDSGTVVATVPALPTGTVGAPAGDVLGHPNTISATTGTPTGKVYITSPDSTDMSILYTDTNTVQQHITLQGLGLRVLVTAP